MNGYGYRIETCPEDEHEAVRYLRLSANRGNSFTECTFGVCLRDGRGVAEDEALGFECMKRTVRIGRLPRERPRGKRSMEQGNSFRQNDYGVCLVDGIGTAANPSEGIAVLKRTADRVLPAAQDNYAVCCENGTVVEKDSAEAAEYYLRAMEGGMSHVREEYERCRQTTCNS
jgi:TPR repeat protein